jgi:hypothetical protein
MARRLTPAEKRELGEALLVRFEEAMRVAYQMFRYHQGMYAKHGGSTYNLPPPLQHPQEGARRRGVQPSHPLRPSVGRGCQG